MTVSLGELAGADHEVLRARAFDIRDVDAHGRVELGLGRDLDDGRLLESVPGNDRRAVAGASTVPRRLSSRDTVSTTTGAGASTVTGASPAS